MEKEIRIELGDENIIVGTPTNNLKAGNRNIFIGSTNPDGGINLTNPMIVGHGARGGKSDIVIGHGAKSGESQTSFHLELPISFSLFNILDL